eukprot:jgi/Mesvir1/26498/Mv16159-RA.1
MAGAWNVYIYIMLPIPIACLALLTLYQPKSSRGASGVVRAVDSILSLPLLNVGKPVKLLDVFLVVATFMVVFCIKSTVADHRFVESEAIDVAQGFKLQAKRWRSDRNFWLSWLILTLWVFLHRAMAMRKQIASLLAQLEERGQGGVPAGSLKKPAAVEADAGKLKKVE